MGMKRKLEVDTVHVFPTAKRQQKLVPFPSMDVDMDVEMSDDSAEPLPPLCIPLHARLPSTASTLSSLTSGSSASSSPGESPNYPMFDLYPHEAPGYMEANFHYHCPTATQKAIGLLQPKNAAFSHHGQNCSQIPKLRVACSPGLNGARSMWAFCEQCGAIEMVDTD